MSLAQDDGEVCCQISAKNKDEVEHNIINTARLNCFVKKKKLF